VIDRELTFERDSHSADAIQRAAYRLSDRLSIDLRSNEQVLTCMTHVETDDSDLADSIVTDFRKEVLDQVLRERIRDETEGVRNLILALAFSNTGLGSEV
jgi:His-Xaa-Ser system protein HxsD